MTTSFSKLQVVYYTQQVINDKSSYSNDTIEASICQNFTSPLLDKADDWVLTVERAEISLNAVPFYEGTAGDTINTFEIDQNIDNQLIDDNETSIEKGDANRQSTLTNSTINTFQDVLVEEWPANFRAYSLQHLLERLTQIAQLHWGYTVGPLDNRDYNMGNNRKDEAMFEETFDEDDVKSQMKFKTDIDGKVVISIDPVDEDAGIYDFNWFDNFKIVFPEKLNRILGIGYPYFNRKDLYEQNDDNDDIDLQKLTDEGYSILLNKSDDSLDIFSNYSRTDCGDFLTHIRLTSNIPVYSDNTGNNKTNILTDIGLPSNWNVSSDFQSVTSLSGGDIRQKLIYVPTQRRYVNIGSPSPIVNIRISAEWVDVDGKGHIIDLPTGCIFAIKLGFYYKA